MKIGIIGTGPMAHTFADTLIRMKDVVELEAVASRTLDKALQFKEEYGFKKAYGSYEELVNDNDVELVYIVTPQNTHADLMKLCIEGHKAVLCEKSFTVNTKEAKEVYEMAKRERVFVAEALWPRYMPSRKIINDVLASGTIGKPNVLTGNLAYVIYMNDRIVNPQKGGGALLDVGIYGINFAFQVFGSDYERIESSVQFTDTGVDGMETITIFYKDGRMAVLTHSIYSRSDRKGIIYGDKGYMVVENINNPESVDVYDLNDALIEHHDIPEQISGYEYEIMECDRCLKEGKLEADSMPLSDSIKMMETYDEIRGIWGLKYPFE